MDKSIEQMAMDGAEKMMKVVNQATKHASIYGSSFIRVSLVAGEVRMEVVQPAVCAEVQEILFQKSKAWKKATRGKDVSKK